VAGRGWFYFVTMAAVFAVLCFSANTSFADFPRLCRLLARDEFLPARFGHRGRRLIYAPGIILLALVAAALLIVFGGVTDRLIPLFAIGAFLAFTMSQLGMVFHWRRNRGAGARRSMVFNAVGAAATGGTLVVVAVSKFAEGGWASLLIAGALMLAFLAARGHHHRVDAQVAIPGPLVLRDRTPPILLVPLRRLDRASRDAIAVALRLSPEVQAVQFLTEAPDEPEDLTATWSAMVEEPSRAANVTVPRLTVIRSKYRNLLEPLLEHVRRIATLHPDRTIGVVVAEIIERRWYQQVVHRHRASLLKAALVRFGGSRVVVVDVPCHIE
jgi:hypothetical protein